VDHNSLNTGEGDNMPTYLMKNTETNEVFEKTMKIAEYEQYLKDNPTHIRHYDGIDSIAAFTGDHVVVKKDTGFKEVLQKIHEKTPGSQLNRISTQI
jgi:hypothetical protein